jgi:hypothetical protein
MLLGSCLCLRRYRHRRCGGGDHDDRGGYGLGADCRNHAGCDYDRFDGEVAVETEILVPGQTSTRLQAHRTTAKDHVRANWRSGRMSPLSAALITLR